MKIFFNYFVWMFGGLCLLTLVIEFPYTVYRETEFSLTAQTMVYYLIFSSLFALYRAYSAKKFTGKSVESI